MLGDENQLWPIIISKFENNGFVRLMAMSLFYRMKLLDHFTMLLPTQHRMVEKIGSMISRFHYDDLVQNGPITTLTSRFVIEAFQDHAHRKWSKRSSLIFLNAAALAPSRDQIIGNNRLGLKGYGTGYQDRSVELKERSFSD